MKRTLAKSDATTKPILYERRFKRLFDLLLALPAAILVAPFAALIAVLVKSEDGGPVLFSQARVGAEGEVFVLRKFRSMPVGTPNVESGRAHDLRVTRVGRFLRRTSLDEVPQLLSVVKGEMSIVGPRPPIPSQIDVVEYRRQNGAISLKPGLTGLAQVNGYDGMSPREKADWDGKYLASISLLTDVIVVIRTLGYVMRKPPQY